jgi:hypothetical protein
MDVVDHKHEHFDGRNRKGVIKSVRILVQTALGIVCGISCTFAQAQHESNCKPVTTLPAFEQFTPLHALVSIGSPNFNPTSPPNFSLHARARLAEEHPSKCALALLSVQNLLY